MWKYQSLSSCLFPFATFKACVFFEQYPGNPPARPLRPELSALGSPAAKCASRRPDFQNLFPHTKRRAKKVQSSEGKVQ